MSRRPHLYSLLNINIVLLAAVLRWRHLTLHSTCAAMLHCTKRHVSNIVVYADAATIVGQSTGINTVLYQLGTCAVTVSFRPPFTLLLVLMSALLSSCLETRNMCPWSLLDPWRRQIAQIALFLSHSAENGYTQNGSCCRCCHCEVFSPCQRWMQMDVF